MLFNLEIIEIIGNMSRELWDDLPATLCNTEQQTTETIHTFVKHHKIVLVSTS